MKETRLKHLEASDERQYMMNDQYEVYEKTGAPIGASSFHYHNFYEIIYVVEGEYSSLIENQTYHLKKGDFLLINANVMHKYHFIEEKHDTSKRIILWITQEMLESLSVDEMNLCDCFRKQNRPAYHFPAYYEELLRGYLLRLAMTDGIEGALPGTKKILDKGYLALFFVYLNTLCADKKYIFSPDDMDSHPMVGLVSDYIEGHISENISIDELADAVHMSKFHFLRRFKELTGVTVHTFIINKRLIKACEGLKEGKNITLVYQETGFGDYSSFLRNFKKVYGVSPKKYTDFY